MKKLINKKSLILIVFVGLFICFWSLGFQDYLNLEYLKNNLAQLQARVAEAPLQAMLIYFLVYVVLTAISFPGAGTFLTLMSGALFGLLNGFIIVSFASTIGATLAFLFSRYLFRDYVQNKFGKYLKTINQGLEHEGALYLLSLRLIPAFPFFVINLAMGLTAIPARTFYIFSQLGMIPGTLAYIYAGQEFSKITSLKGLLSPSFILALALLGILPIIFKFVMRKIEKAKLYKRFKKPKKFDYNLISIGAGSAGLVTCYIGAAVKARVALIEKHKMGGDCLNTGCVPSKAIIRSAKYIHSLKNSKVYGVDKVDFQFSFQDVMKRVHKVISEVAPHDSVERYTELGVECITGEATILSPYEVQVNGKVLTTKNIVISTGAAPLLPDFPGLREVKYYTSDTIWSLQALPARLLVIGGGAIGCELAQAFSMLGSTVTLVETASRIFRREDEDVSQFMEAQFLKQGITLHLNAKLKQFKKNDQKQEAVIEMNQEELGIEFDAVIMALGRKANVRNFGLENLGVELNPQGTIKVDAMMRTNYPNIFACGDVAGPFQLTHAAAHQAWFAAVNALFSPWVHFKINYDTLPWTTFTSPEVSHVGLSEEQLKEQKVDYQVIKYDMEELDRAIADSTNHGFVKVLTRGNTDQILGVTIVSEHASDLLTEFVLAMKYKLGLNKILGTIHAYPTMSEANKYAAGVWKKKNAPEKLLTYVKKYHEFIRGV